jgi:anti-anti-sigma factor
MDQAVHVSSGDDGTLTIALRGEIDYVNATAVSGAAVDAVTVAGPVAVCVDLAAVTFLDSSGIAALIKVYRSAHGAAAKFRVAGANRGVYEQLRLTGLSQLFEIEAPAP